LRQLVADVHHFFNRCLLKERQTLEQVCRKSVILPARNWWCRWRWLALRSREPEQIPGLVVLPLLMVDNSALHANRLTTSVACRIVPENLIRSESVREVADAARLVLASTPTAALPGLAGLDMVAWLVLPSPVRHRPSPAAPQTTHPIRLPKLSPPGVPDRIDPIIHAGDPLVCGQKPPRRPQTD